MNSIKKKKRTAEPTLFPEAVLYPATDPPPFAVPPPVAVAADPVFDPPSPAAVATDPVFDPADLFSHLARSRFRSRFHLSPRDRDYVRIKGLDAISRHAADFVARRLAPADPPNDGRQTPMRGHPVFVAQHATACCCRGCLARWHHIPPGHSLTAAEQRYVVRVLMAWIGRELAR